MFDGLPLAALVAVFGGAAAFTWFAGWRLARIADDIAEHTGIGRELLGLVMLGGITSLPELAVALTSVWRSTPEIAVSNVLGSAAVNLVILAIADAAIGKDALTSVQGSAQVLLQAVLGMILLAIPAMAYVTGDRLVLGLGISSWVMLGVYLFSMRLLSRSHAGDGWSPSRSRASEDVARRPSEEQSRSTRRLVLRAAGAGAVILPAGWALTVSGDAIATATGLGSNFFAVIFLAMATSLPEISTVLSAVRLRRYEMAISDILGTNLFNVTIVVLVDALHGGPPVLVGAGRSAVVGSLLALLLTAVFLVGLIERRDRTVLRMGIDSLVALAVYAGGVAILYSVR